MELFFNDASLEGQFSHHIEFEKSLETILQMRAEAQKRGFPILCDKDALETRPIVGDKYLQQIISKISESKKRVFMYWITKDGSYWGKEKRQHKPDDYLMAVLGVKEEPITDTGLGEAVIRKIQNHTDSRTISIFPSQWDIPSIDARWHKNDTNIIPTTIPNYTKLDILQKALTQHREPPSYQNWEQTKKFASEQFQSLQTLDKAWTPLDKHPFSQNTAENIIRRLGILNQIKEGYNLEGKQKEQSQELYNDHFTGDRAWFSDSSQTEKSKFKAELSFILGDNGQKRMCGWHAKLNSPHDPIRIHFSDLEADQALYIVYIGVKITK